MTPDQLADIERLAAVAAPPPWRERDGDMYSSGSLICTHIWWGPDGAFIAAAREAVPAMAAEIRRLELEAEQLRYGLSRLGKPEEPPSDQHEQWFRCPRCGGSHFGRDTARTVDGKTAVLTTVRCHDEYGCQCQWRGEWPQPKEEPDHDA